MTPGELWRRLVFLVRREHFREELEEEMRFHLEQRGTPAGFGNPGVIQERAQDAWGLRWLDELRQDLRYALRTLLRTPAFTVAAVLTLALGIGANTAVFSLIKTVLLRPLPYPHPEQILSVSATTPQMALGPAVADADFAAWHAEARSFVGLAAYSRSAVILTGKGDPEQVTGAGVSGDFFSVFGVAPALGRSLTGSDARAGAPPVVVLSHALWDRRFGGTEAVLGQMVTFDGVARQVVGVMPTDFRYPSNAGYWIPRSFGPSENPPGVLFFVTVVGRVAPGVPVSQAQAELQGIQTRGDPQRPEPARGATVSLVSLHERMYGAARAPLLALLGAVGFVLLIACATIANLLIARAASRRREFAIRSSLGAGRGRLVRQLLVESVVVSVVGGLLGLALPLWGTGALSALLPAAVAPIGAGAGPVDAGVLLFAAGLAVLTGVVFGLAPVAGLAESVLAETMKAGSPGGGGAGGQTRLRQGLVVVQLASALVLLAGAGLLTRSLATFLAIDPGFDPRNVLGVWINLPHSRYATEEARSAFFRQLLENTRTLPGVASAAQADAIPLFGFGMLSHLGVDGAFPRNDATTLAAFNSVTADYLSTVGMTMTRGRWLTAQDGPGAPQVAVINEAFARTRFSGVDPIGHRLYVPGPIPRQPVVVGVVRDVRQLSDAVDATPEAYFAAAQDSYSPSFLALKTSVPPLSLLPAVKRAAAAIDPGVAVSIGADLAATFADTYATRRVDALLVGGFAAVALLLAALGLYGVMSYLVIQRTREIGIRMALGASQSQVLGLVIGQGLAPTLLGLTLGLLGALALTRLLHALLFRVSPTDPLVFASVALILSGVSLGASYLPARRATRVDPLAALRWE